MGLFSVVPSSNPQPRLYNSPLKSLIRGEGDDDDDDYYYYLIQNDLQLLANIMNIWFQTVHSHNCKQWRSAEYFKQVIKFFWVVSRAVSFLQWQKEVPSKQIQWTSNILKVIHIMEHKIRDGRTVFRESINPILRTPLKCHYFLLLHPPWHKRDIEVWWKHGLKWLRGVRLYMLTSDLTSLFPVQSSHWLQVTKVGTVYFFYIIYLFI